MNFAIIDIETTGSLPKDLRVIEIAVILHDGQNETGKFHSLVDPCESITPFISRLTGIRDRDVAGAPKFFEIAKKVIELTEGCVFVAHNVGFDYSVIRTEFKRLGYDYRKNHLDTIQAAKVLFPGHTSYGLKNITKVLGIEMGKHHRATEDTAATAILFAMLYKEDTHRLERFIRREVDPTLLHPKLDMAGYDEVPNKTGVYRFFDESGELIYIGKSIRIKVRIGEHLKNNKTQKALDLRQRIASITHDVTGSELIALLVESAEIKEKQPIYNRSQRNTSFGYGLYCYSDLQGYQRLQVKKKNLTEQPVTSFKSLVTGKSSLRNWIKEFELCEKLCGLQDTKSACFQHSIKQCKGACILEESPESYNERVEALRKKLHFSGASFLLLDKGRTSRESGFVYIQDGEYKGYGFAPKYMLKRDPQNFQKLLIRQDNNRDFQSLIRMQMEKNTKLVRIPLNAEQKNERLPPRS